MIFLTVMLLMVLAAGLGYKIGWEKSRKYHAPKHDNPFIRAHKSMQERDLMYEKYVDWCYKSGTYPLEAMEFQSELENNLKLREAVQKAMNS